MRNTNRLIALALCFTLTLGAFVYRPPEAKALVGVDDAVVIGALLSAFAGGCGLIFSNNGMSSNEIAQGLTAKWNDFKETLASVPVDFPAWLGYDSMDALITDLRWDEVKDVLSVPRTVARKFADFTDWLTDNLGVTSSNSVPIISSNMQTLSGASNGYSVLEEDMSFYTYSFLDNGLSLSAKSSSGSLAVDSLTFTSPAFVAPETGHFDISFSSILSYLLIGSSKNYRNSGIAYVQLYKTSGADSDNFGFAGNILETQYSYSWTRFPSCSGSYRTALVAGEKFYYKICLNAPKSFLSLNVAWKFSIQRSSAVSDFSAGTLAGVQTPDLADDAETAPTPTITGVGWDAATIEELLQQILDQLQANTLATTISVDATQTGGETGTDTDEDAKPYLPFIPQIFDKVKEIPGTLSNIWDTVKGLPAAIAERISAFFTTLWGWLQDIITEIKALPSAIAEKVGALFTPDEALVTEITDTFKGKFGFLSNLNAFVNDLFSLTPETEPPVIWVHLENAESKYGYVYGDKQKILDLSWYQKYKGSVDGILSGFLWLGYLWLLFKRAPSILNGMALADDDAPRSADIPDTLNAPPRLNAGDGSTMFRGDGFTMRDKGARGK